MTKERLQEKIEDIKDMGEKELSDFKIILATSDAGVKARKFLYKAIKLRDEELSDRYNAMAVDGDINDASFY